MLEYIPAGPASQPASFNQPC